MDDLVTWLRAQLDDDERAALAAPAGPWHTPGPDTIAEWTVYDAEWSVATATAYDHNESLGNIRGPGYIDPNATAVHIARWDPKRVLAKVAADRRVIETLRSYEPNDEWDTQPDMGLRLNNAAGALRALALPYADRPGYRDDWRPNYSGSNGFSHGSR